MIREGELKGEHVVGVDPRIHRIEPAKAAEKESRAHEKQHRCRHLRDHQSCGDPVWRARGRAASAAFPQCSFEMSPRQAPRRHDA